MIGLARAGLANDDDPLNCHGMGPRQSAQAISDPDLDMMEKLGLLEGHLLIGMALHAAQMKREALPHFGHPVRELYDYLKPQMLRRNVEGFEPELLALEEKAKTGTPSDAEFKAIVTRLDRLRLSVAAEKRQSPRFLLDTLALLMEDVAEDYGEAIDKGRIGNIVEYHDAMGFLRYIANSVAARRTAADARLAGQLAQVETQIARARRAFPSLQPPARPGVSVSDLRACADAIARLAKSA